MERNEERDVNSLTIEFDGMVFPTYVNKIGTVSQSNLNTDQQASIAPQSVKPVQDEFEGFEHKAIGDRAYQFFVDKVDADIIDLLKKYRLLTQDEDSMIARWTFSNDMQLTFGDIVALAGDFYGVPDKPISSGTSEEDKADRFIAAYRSLALADREEVHKILSQISRERGALHKAVHERQKPNIGVEKVLKKGNVTYGAITKYTFLPCSFLYSRYIDLAKNNFDHFGLEAREAYRVGHACARRKVEEAKVAIEESIQMLLLRDALTMELFAQHFFTDLFASGHVRTPRKAIFNYVQGKKFTPGKSAIAGLLAKEMHDEDNRAGLKVKNQRGQSWESFGDACYFEPKDGENRDIVSEAVADGLVDLIDCFLGNESNYDFNTYIPVPSLDDMTKPLFIEEDNGIVKVRPVDGESAQHCSLVDYQENWNPVQVLCRIKARQFGKKVIAGAEKVHHHHGGDAVKLSVDEKAELETELYELYSSTDDVAIRVGDEKDSKSCVIC